MHTHTHLHALLHVEVVFNIQTRRCTGLQRAANCRVEELLFCFLHVVKDMLKFLGYERVAFVLGSGASGIPGSEKRGEQQVARSQSFGFRL